jgi:hypothetical protein
MNISTPCKNICKFDKTDTYCIGCYRTINEIAKWMLLTEEDRKNIIMVLPERKQRLR